MNDSNKFSGFPVVIIVIPDFGRVAYENIFAKVCLGFFRNNAIRNIRDSYDDRNFFTVQRFPSWGRYDGRLRFGLLRSSCASHCENQNGDAGGKRS